MKNPYNKQAKGAMALALAEFVGYYIPGVNWPREDGPNAIDLNAPLPPISLLDIQRFQRVPHG